MRGFSGLLSGLGLLFFVGVVSGDLKEHVMASMEEIVLGFSDGYLTLVNIPPYEAIHNMRTIVRMMAKIFS